MHHSLLLVFYLEWLKIISRALIGGFSITTEAALEDKQLLVNTPGNEKMLLFFYQVNIIEIAIKITKD
jgi:hypothetical protein